MFKFFFVFFCIFSNFLYSQDFIFKKLFPEKKIRIKENDYSISPEQENTSKTSWNLKFFGGIGNGNGVVQNDLNGITQTEFFLAARDLPPRAAIATFVPILYGNTILENREVTSQNFRIEGEFFNNFEKRVRLLAGFSYHELNFLVSQNNNLYIPLMIISSLPNSELSNPLSVFLPVYLLNIYSPIENMRTRNRLPEAGIQFHLFPESKWDVTLAAGVSFFSRYYLRAGTRYNFESYFLFAEVERNASFGNNRSFEFDYSLKRGFLSSYTLDILYFGAGLKF